NASAYVSGFLVQKYFISEGWRKHHIYIGDEYDSEHSTLKVISQLKLGIVMKMLTDNLQKIKEATKVNEQEQLLKIQKEIDGYKNIIASSLGRIVLPTMKLLEDQ
ncbi:MAG: hypothetical protein ACK4RF_11835, partial [Cyclobacteriaceae bacterium]